MKFSKALALSFLLIVSLYGCISVGLNKATIILNDPVAAKGADKQSRPLEPTSEFKTTDKKMWGTISATAPTGTSIGYRWYHGDKLIVDDRIQLDSQGRAAIFLQAPEGGSFPEGDYRVELYLVKATDKIVYYKVTK